MARNRIPFVALTAMLAIGCGKKTAKQEPTAEPPVPQATKPARPAGPVGEMIVPESALSNDTVVSAIAVAGDDVFWTSMNAAAGVYRLMRTPVVGGESQIVVDGHTSDLVATTTHAVWRSGRMVQRVAAGGGAIETVHTGAPCSLAATDKDIFVAEAHQLIRVGADGSRTARDVPEVDLCNGPSIPAPGGVVWWGHPSRDLAAHEERELWWIPDDGAASRLAAAPIFLPGGIHSLAVAGDAIVYTGPLLGENAGVFRRPITGTGEVQHTFADRPIVHPAVAADGTVYAAALFDGDGSDYKVYRLATDGTHHLLAVHDFDFMAAQMVLRGDYVYWHDMDRIQRVKTN